MTALLDSLRHQTVGELALRPPISVKGPTIVRAAVAQMRFKELGCATVVDAMQRPRGIFTERSVIEALIQDASLDKRVVGDFVDPNYLQVGATEPIARVWEAVQRDHFRFVCVTDERGKLIGTTGQRGLAEYVARMSAAENQKEQILGNVLGEEVVGDIPARPCPNLTSDVRVRTAVHTLHDLNVASVLVVDDGKLVGIFTERDVLERVAENYAKVADTPLRDVMTPNPLVANRKDPAHSALSAIAREGYRHLPVLNDHDELLGVVSPRRVFAFLEERLCASSK